MAVLHLSTHVSGDLDETTTPLGRSLRAQTCNRWRLDRWPSPSTPEADDLVAHAPPELTLDPRAVEVLLGALAGRPDAAAVYHDAVVEEHGSRFVDLRPAWSPDLLRARRYTGDLLAVRSAVVDELGVDPGASAAGPHELALRLAERDEVVLHVPSVLATGPPQADTTDSAMAAVAAHLRRTGRPMAAQPGITPGTVRLVPRFGRPPPVTVVVPTAGACRPGERLPLIARSLGSLDRVDWPDLRVIVVVGDEYAGDPGRLRDWSTRPVEVVRRSPGAFSFSQAVNTGILAASTELVVMLNDDVEALDDGVVGHLAMHAVDEGVGAVGAVLRYPDGTVQHAGMAIDDARPLHSFVRRPLDAAGTGGRPAETRNVIAVTGACLMIRRSTFLSVGGMTPELPLSFNDVDLCLRLLRRGLRVVVEPGGALLHHESATRPPEIAAWEWDRYVHRWGAVADPWYHPAHFRPDDPHHLHRNVDHLPPIGPVFDPRPRDTSIRPRVHRTRADRAGDLGG